MSNLSRESGEYREPKVNECECEVLVKEITEKNTNSDVRPFPMNQ